MTVRKFTWRLTGMGLVASALSVGAQAQVVERHPAPVPPSPAAQAAPPAEVDRNADATPLGPRLQAIHIDTGAGGTLSVDSTNSRPKAGIPGLSIRLGRFIGRELSRKLIAEIRAEIAREYRAAGRPFVYVSTPEQDLTDGTLVLRVQEFTQGRSEISGASAQDARLIAKSIRQKAGEPIDAGALSEDLDWLNRYPFRRVDAVFAPGDKPATTDVTYRVREQPRWIVGGGYANSGSPDTGMNRFDLYALAALPVIPDAWASYQLTTSGPGIVSLGDPPPGAKRYVSHAARISVPTGARQGLEMTFDDIQSVQPVQAFDVRQHTREWSLDYRAALANLGRRLPGEAYLGLSWKTQGSVLGFGGRPVRTTTFHVGQIDGGYHWFGYDDRGSAAFELAVHFSPGGLDDLDTAAAYSAASQGVSQAARYAYANGSLSRVTRLAGFNLDQTLFWQYSRVRLPQTELFGLGGPGLVRTYTLDDGAFDRGVLLRNELRMTPYLWSRGPHWSSAQPYVYADGGYAGRVGMGSSRVIGSVGGGVEMQFDNCLTVALDAGVSLAPLGNTRAGSGRGNVRIGTRF